MYPYITILNHNLSTYSLFALLGIIAAMIYCFFISVRKKLNFNQCILFLIYGIPFAFLGALLLYWLTRAYDIAILFEGAASVNFTYFIKNIPIGFVYYGGLMGFLVGISIYPASVGTDMRRELYYLTPAIPLFHSFGRIGCYLSGCCYGKYNIPVQLVEAAINLLIFIILCNIIKKPRKNFYSLGLYFVIYGIVRFMLEFLRGDEIRGIILGLSTSQWISLIIIPLGIYNLAADNEKNHFNKWFNKV